MSDEISERKQELRKLCKSIRKELGNNFRQQASRQICEHLASWKIFQGARVILSYMPMRSEVDLSSLFIDFPGKCWLIPRILQETDGQMVFHLYDPNHLVQHPFGMDEPASYLPQNTSDDIELTLVPGLAFSQTGWRLGC